MSEEENDISISVKDILNYRIKNDKWWEGSEKATMIRSVCEPVCRGLTTLLHDESLTKDEQSEIYTQFEIANGRLIEMGVRNNSNEGMTLEEIMSNPEALAIHIAKYLVPLTGIDIPNSRDSVPDEIQRHKRKDGLPADTKDWIFATSITNLAETFFQYN